jgi:hypothetical protein
MRIDNTNRRYREVRDVYKHLRAKYRNDVVMEFIEQNYFIGTHAIYDFLTKADSEPVTEPSVIYKTVMSDHFKL